MPGRECRVEGRVSGGRQNLTRRLSFVFFVVSTVVVCELIRLDFEQWKLTNESLIKGDLVDLTSLEFFPRVNYDDDESLNISTTPNNFSTELSQLSDLTRLSSVPLRKDNSTDAIETIQNRAELLKALMANYTRPDLDSIIDPETNKIIGDPQFLLDFAVVGFGKCGTSTIMHWLASHPEVQMFRNEVWELMFHKPHQLIQLLYLELPPGHFKRGYKSPGDITQTHILEYFRTFFPKTRLIVGVRHPVRWFESLYNFRVQNLPKGDRMPEPNKLIGLCGRGTRQTCTEKGNYAYSLLRLGKSYRDGQPLNPELRQLEEKIVGRFRRARYNISQVEYIPNQIFLFEVEQLADTNLTRTTQFRHDFQSFLGLKTALPPIGHHKPGRRWDDKTQRIRDEAKIDICDEKWASIRKDLMTLSRMNSLWLRSVFLESRDVHFSSHPYLLELLERWMIDPCGGDTIESDPVWPVFKPKVT